MPIQASELVFEYTDGATGPSNANLSKGGTISGNSITSGLSNNIFDDVTGDESQNGTIEYRAIAIQNENTTINLTSAKVWISGYVRDDAGTPDTIYFAVQTPYTTTVPHSISFLSDEYSWTPVPSFTPTWVVEGSPSNTVNLEGTVGVGTLGMNGDWCGIWLKREVPAGATAFNNRSCTIKVQGETSASPLRTIEKTFVVTWTKDAFNVVEIS